mmetsp:Transcript_73541/g.153528  ORF Transcript_73541/g.153528 Transcript_73541/m.153528 type:complete len:93 (+) Transcript_73541:3-281(+)
MVLCDVGWCYVMLDGAVRCWMVLCDVGWCCVVLDGARVCVELRQRMNMHAIAHASISACACKSTRYCTCMHFPRRVCTIIPYEVPIYAALPS